MAAAYDWGGVNPVADDVIWIQHNGQWIISKHILPLGTTFMMTKAANTIKRSIYVA